jgi:hypothetical protein
MSKSLYFALTPTFRKVGVVQLRQSASFHPPITKNEPHRLLISPHFDQSFRFVFLIPLQIRRRSGIGHALENAATLPDLQFHFFLSQKTGSTHHDPHRNINGRSRIDPKAATAPKLAPLQTFRLQQHLPGRISNQGEPSYRPPHCQ